MSLAPGGINWQELLKGAGSFLGGPWGAALGGILSMFGDDPLADFQESLIPDMRRVADLARTKNPELLKFFETYLGGRLTPEQQQMFQQGMERTYGDEQLARADITRTVGNPLDSSYAMGLWNTAREGSRQQRGMLDLGRLAEVGRNQFLGAQEVGNTLRNWGGMLTSMMAGTPVRPQSNPMDIFGAIGSAGQMGGNSEMMELLRKILEGMPTGPQAPPPPR